MAQIIPQPEVITQYPGVTTLQPAVVTSQPIAVNPFYQYKDGWRVGFCNCCSDVAQCCYAYWCWPCFLCSLGGKINEPCVACFCVPNILAVYRMKIRTNLRIEGDSCDDCCATTCCPCCAALQMRNELIQRGFG